MNAHEQQGKEINNLIIRCKKIQGNIYELEVRNEKLGANIKALCDRNRWSYKIRSGKREILKTYKSQKRFNILIVVCFVLGIIAMIVEPGVGR